MEEEERKCLQMSSCPSFSCRIGMVFNIMRRSVRRVSVKVESYPGWNQNFKMKSFAEIAAWQRRPSERSILNCRITCAICLCFHDLF